MNIEISNKNGYWGMIEGNEIIIPFEHETKEWAIEEWYMWEMENLRKQFLPHKRTLEDIDKIKIELLNK